MELPFAVESTNHSLPHRVVYQDDDDDGGGDGTSSLVTASSRSSLLETSQTSYEPIRAVQNHQSRGGVGYPYANTQKPSSFASVPPSHHTEVPHPVTEFPGNRPDVVPPFSNFDGLDSVLSQFGVTPPSAEPLTSQQGLSNQPRTAATADGMPSHPENSELLNDFTYITVCETEEDEGGFVLEAAEGDATRSPFDMDAERSGRSDMDSILAMLVRDAAPLDPSVGEFPSIHESANHQAQSASLAKKRGDLVQAIHCHTSAAKLYRDAATRVREDCLSMRNSLLVLSQTQAKTALSLKRIVRVRPNSLLFPTSTTTTPGQKPSSHQELLLRAKVRGALSSKTEEDISNSTFLGKASNYNTDTSPSIPATVVPQRNPVDEMIELERELRNMDMAIEMGSSIASLEARAQHRMKTSIVEGSFMVVPPGSNSYMSSSSVANAPHIIHGTHSTRQATPTSIGITGTASVRARANRVQSLLEASGRPATASPPSVSILNQTGGTGVTSNKPLAITSLDSSWWGNSSQASQVLTSSVISLANGIGTDHTGLVGGGTGPTSTKQLLMHMDSFKTLRDENEALLKEVVGAKAARMEAKAAKEQMLRFRDEYGKRFAALKEALDKYRKEYPLESTSSHNPVATSDFARSSSAASEQLARQEQLIKKLTADLKKEKEESKKKDSALLKYETFYREVKARSAAKQRQKEAQQQVQQQSQRQAVRQPAKPLSR